MLGKGAFGRRHPSDRFGFIVGVLTSSTAWTKRSLAIGDRRREPLKMVGRPPESAGLYLETAVLRLQRRGFGLCKLDDSYLTPSSLTVPCRFAFKTRLFALHDATSHRRLQRRIRPDLYMNS
jgi:hypothetical protein